MAAIERTLEPEKEISVDITAVEAAAADGLLVTLPVPGGHCPVIDMLIEAVAAGNDAQVVWGNAALVGPYGIPSAMGGAGVFNMLFASNGSSGAATDGHVSGGSGAKTFIAQAIPMVHGKVGFRGQAMRIKITANDGTHSWTSGTIKLRFHTEPLHGQNAF